LPSSHAAEAPIMLRPTAAMIVISAPSVTTKIIKETKSASDSDAHRCGTRPRMRHFLNEMLT
jgi:hypothetical protein